MARQKPPANTAISARGRTTGAVPMTAAGLSALQAELVALEGEARREIAQRIKTAREWGDLKEVASRRSGESAGVASARGGC
jgi:Transcription elongation factor, N-terminal